MATETEAGGNKFLMEVLNLCPSYNKEGYKDFPQESAREKQTIEFAMHL